MLGSNPVQQETSQTVSPPVSVLCFILANLSASLKTHLKNIFIITLMQRFFIRNLVKYFLMDLLFSSIFLPNWSLGNSAVNFDPSKCANIRWKVANFFTKYAQSFSASFKMKIVCQKFFQVLEKIQQIVQVVVVIRLVKKNQNANIMKQLLW